MNEDVKIVHDVIQCVLFNSSKCHDLEPLIKGVIEKMAYLVELWLILESELVERAPHGMFVVWISKFYTEYYRLYYNQKKISY
jgi:hypothetical protein